MKKTFIILVAFVYLVTGIGFVSMQCICQHMRNSEAQNESHSCCTNYSNESAQSCKLSEKTDSKSCCSKDTESGLPATNGQLILPDDCCDVQPQYSQLERSSLPLNFDVNHTVKSISVLQYYPHSSQNVYRCALMSFETAAAQVNSPLLI